MDIRKKRRIGNTHEHESCFDYNTAICPDGGTITEGDLNPTHLKFCSLAMQTPNVGEICEYPEVSSSYVKNRGIAMAITLSLHQQNIVASTFNVLLLTLNKALPGGRSRITRFVLILISH